MTGCTYTFILNAISHIENITIYKLEYVASLNIANSCQFHDNHTPQFYCLKYLVFTAGIF